MARGAHRCADARARRDPRGDEARDRRAAAAARRGRAAARSALCERAASVLGWHAPVLPPSVARLAAFPAAERAATYPRAVLPGPGSRLERDSGLPSPLTRQ